MIVIFDFDRVLFDVNKFKKDLAKVIGVDYKNDYKKTYDRLFVDAENNKTDYDLNRHLKELGKDNEPTRKKIKNFFKTAGRYLMPGSTDLLEKLKTRGDELYLATFGNITWQKQKVNALKELDEYFDGGHKIFADKDKIKSLDFLKNKNEPMLLINDNKKEGLAMKKFFGKNAKLYLIKGDYSEENKGHVYNNLREIIKKLF